MTPIHSPGAQPLVRPDAAPRPDPPSARPEPEPRSFFNPIEVVVSLIILGVLAALLLPVCATRCDVTPHVRCASNLSQLWDMHRNYQAQFGGRKLLPADTGAAFWLLLTRTPPRGSSTPLSRTSTTVPSRRPAAIPPAASTAARRPT